MVGTMQVSTAGQEGLPLHDILKRTKSPLRGVSALEVYTAYTTLLGKQPPRDEAHRCLYAHSDIELILDKSSVKTYQLRELDEWKKSYPLAYTLSRSDAIKRLVVVGNPGWLSRCSYKRGRLLLCQSDAEQLCLLRKSGYGETPLRWSAPLARV